MVSSRVGLALLLMGSLWAPAEAVAQSDTISSVREVNERLRYYYRTSPRFGSVDRGGLETELDRVCDGGSALCHGGDPDRGYCPQNVYCHPTEEFLLDALLEEAGKSPNSGFVLGQAVYGLVKFRFLEDAAALVNGCEAEEWWCNALRGYLLHDLGRMAEAETLFREAVAGAPSSFLCDAGDALWLLGEWDQRPGDIDHLPDARVETAGWSCEERLAASDTLLWLADPLFNDPGNDRWTEHMARALAAHFAWEIRRATRGAEVPQRYVDHDRAMRIRRGTWDSFDLPPGRSEVRFWTSEAAARYHFVPDVKAGDWWNPVWRLNGTLLDEGYSPDLGPFFPVPVQIARFRGDGTLRLAASADLRGPPFRRVPEAQTYLVLSQGPGSVNQRLEEVVHRSNPVFVGEFEPGRSVLALEVMMEIGIGWERRVVSPLLMNGPELSDLLLFRPSSDSVPGSLTEAAAVMLPQPVLEEGVALGVYWETYGAPAGAELQFSLTLQRDTGGIVDRLRALLPGGAQEGQGQVAWSEEGEGEGHSRSLSLDLEELDEGNYVVVVRVEWFGQPPMEKRRSFTIGG